MPLVVRIPPAGSSIEDNGPLLTLVTSVRPLETLALRSDLTTFYAVENNPHCQVS
jgi:hypothetical protein